MFRIHIKVTSCLVINLFADNKFSTLPNWKILQRTISYLMKIAESSSNQLESTVGKVENACYEQFLLFPLCFQKTCTTDT